MAVDAKIIHRLGFAIVPSNKGRDDVNPLAVIVAFFAFVVSGSAEAVQTCNQRPLNNSLPVKPSSIS